MPAMAYTQRTCIIVVHVKDASAPLLIGIAVDEVSEVLTLTGADIEDTPDFGALEGSKVRLGRFLSRSARNEQRRAKMGTFPWTVRLS